MGTLIYSGNDGNGFGKLKPDAAHLRIMETYKGQAHIAGTGPEGTTCRECAHWGTDRPQRYRHFGHRKNCLTPGELKEGQCHRGKAGQIYQLLPHDAKSCLWFEPAKNPPAARTQPPKKAEASA